MRPTGTNNVAFVAGGLLWIVTLGAGLSLMWRYENAPGLDLHTAPKTWPLSSRIVPSKGRPLLVMMLHPQCPCSMASLGELALIMARAQGTLDAHVVFYKAPGTAPDWHETDSWRAASRIPGVSLNLDPERAEQRRFGAATSGHTLFFDRDGVLQFSGGITPSRGHSGDNAGRTAIISLLMQAQPERRSTFVFGCSLLLDSCPTCRESSGG